MNLRSAIELLAGILVWIGFLMSLPIFGWLVWGVLRCIRNVGRHNESSQGGRSDISTGRLVRRRSTRGDRMQREAHTAQSPGLFLRCHRTPPLANDGTALEPGFVLDHFR